MNKNLVKIFSLLMVVILLTTIFSTVFAGPISPNSITANYGSDDDTKGMKSVAGRVVGLIRNIAVIAGVIILTFLGIKYMLGSVEEKAEYKKSLLPLVVGIVVVMASTQIATLIFGIIGTGEETK
ncbi:MAG: pilin [Clostridia bacterium]|nr:pilin [Clostridia bacterium]